MKRWDLFFLVIRVPLDFLALFGAALTAYFLRFESVIAAWRPGTQLITPESYVKLAITLAGIAIPVFAISGLYRPRKLSGSLADEIVQIFFAVSGTAMFVVAAIFFRQEFFASRFIVLAAWALGISCVAAERLLVRLIRAAMSARGIGIPAVAIIGSGKPAEVIRAELERRHKAVVVSVFPRWDAAAEAELARRRAEFALDEIIIADPALADSDLRGIMDFCDSRQLGVRSAALHPLLQRGALGMGFIGGIPTIELQRTPLEGWGRVYKRIFDLVFGALCTALAIPIGIMVAIAIIVEDRAPVFFAQTRVGRLGKPFRIYKFRSMRPGAHEQWQELRERSEREGPVPKIKDDPRITRVGRILRRWSIDELPQLLNVLRGEMSLVGPRPHLPEEVAHYGSRHRRVLLLSPGITGLAQISGRADLAFEKEVGLDTFYMEHWSPKLDLAILAKTPLAVFSRKGAY
ncbi:MAG: sugar transferase [Patescibacteria group bacterium]